jgi:hypothetical protein
MGKKTRESVRNRRLRIKWGEAEEKAGKKRGRQGYEITKGNRSVVRKISASIKIPRREYER